MPEPAPWYVDYCRPNCDTEGCVGAGRCIDGFEDDEGEPARPVETVQVGDVL